MILFLQLLLAVTLPAALLLTIAVARGWSGTLDRRLLALLPEPTSAGGKPSRLATAAQDLTALGGDTLRLVFLLCCVVGLLADGRGVTAALLVGCFASARLGLLLLKLAVRRPRPDAPRHRVVTYTSSFPSGHTLMAAVLYVSAALLVPVGLPLAVQVGAVMLALAITAGIAATRLTLGIHWPLDVVAGLLLGLAWADGWALAGLSG